MFNWKVNREAALVGSGSPEGYEVGGLGLTGVEVTGITPIIFWRFLTWSSNNYSSSFRPHCASMTSPANMKAVLSLGGLP